jgi:hypothetical protein
MTLADGADEVLPVGFVVGGRYQYGRQRRAGREVIEALRVL